MWAQLPLQEHLICICLHVPLSALGFAACHDVLAQPLAQILIHIDTHTQQYLLVMRL